MKWIGNAWFRLNGWQVAGETPTEPKYVLIAAPHTSNWDLPHMLAASWVFGVRLRWLGKREIFDNPFGGIMKSLGGVPVDRSKNNSLVDQIVQRFDEAEHLTIVVPPSGTRTKRDYWKSGFYHMAVGAKVPIVMGYLNYAKKEAGFGPAFWPSGDLSADMDAIRAFYRDIRGRFPKDESTPRLRGEDASSEENTEEA